MRGVIYEQYGELPHLVTDLPDPACPDDGVVVRVGATGVCRSDWHAWRGHDPVPLPMVPGHELAGTIAQVGPRVARWRPGARVTVPFACGCGRCPQCTAADTHVCPAQTQPGFTGWGSFAEYVALHAADTNLVALPDHLGMVEAAALGCRFATAYAALRQARLAPGDTVLVLGCGGVGLSVVALAAGRGVHVLVVDPAAAARAAAAEWGATHVLDPSGLPPEALAERVREVTGGGVHVSIDALGRADLLAAGLFSLRPRGRHVQVGLLLAEHAAPAVPMGVVIARELAILGVHGLPAARYPAMLAEAFSGQLNLRRLVGRVISLTEAPAALAAMSSAPAGAGLTVVDLAADEPGC